MKSEKAEVRRGSSMRILRYLRPHLGLQIGIAFLMMIAIFLSLIDPLVMKIVIDDVIVDRNTSLLSVIALALLALFVLRSGMSVATDYFLEYVGQRILFDIRIDLFQHVERLDLEFFTKTKTGEIIARVNSDVAVVRRVFAGTLVDLVTDLLSALFIFVVMLLLNWKLALLTTTIFPFLLISQRYMGRQIKKRSRESRDKSAELLSFFQEVFSSILLVKSFVKEKFEAIRLLRKSKELVNVGITLGTLRAVASAIAGFLSAMGPVIVLFFGGRQVMQGTLSLGSLVAFYAYVGRLFMPIYKIAQHNVEIQTARAAIERILEFSDIEPKIVNRAGSKKLQRVRGTIAFDDVSFSYEPEEPILKNVSLRITPGQRVAVVGRSGAGKSTMVGLLQRFYDPISGAVTIDGNDIRDIELGSLRRHIGVISQNTVLFNTTIKENILYGKRGAGDDEVVRAAEQANIHEFISSLPEGYNTIVGERGVRLSGGQAQKLSIARTVLKDPEILILDEAMSSLDTKSEKLIQEALEPIMVGKTTLIIAHRLTSITDADVIFVLRDGRLAEAGTHEELMDKGEVYRVLWDQMIRGGYFEVRNVS